MIRTDFFATKSQAHLPRHLWYKIYKSSRWIYLILRFFIYLENTTSFPLDLPKPNIDLTPNILSTL